MGESSWIRKAENGGPPDDGFRYTDLESEMCIRPQRQEGKVDGAHAARPWSGSKRLYVVPAVGS